jgi:Calcineurin-like phosphoesterase
MTLSAPRASLRPHVARRLAVFVVWVVCAQCSKSPTTPSPGGQGPTVPGPSPTPTLPTPGPVVFAGTGDIAVDGGQADATARLLDTIGGDVFTLGDNAYPNGSRDNFRNVYDRTWGRHLGRTHPAPGNHDYNSPGAAPYFEYFGALAGTPGWGFYSFDLGAWHIVSLNSDYEFGVGVDPGSPQAAWLQADLSAYKGKCTLAYWHHPLFSSGQNGDYPRMRGLFNILYDANADVVLSGHDHLYERFAPQTGDGRSDPARGIREFVVGTGGVPLYPFMTTKPNSEQRINNAWGVLKLTLLAESYQWEFVTTPNGAVRDSGTGQCH